MDAIRVRFEDVTGPRRAEVFAELDEWLGTTGTLSAVASEHQPSLMATAPPRPRRWEPRAHVLAPVLASEAIAEMTTLLDYENRSTWA